jgi:hypothetical protein
MGRGSSKVSHALAQQTTTFPVSKVMCTKLLVFVCLLHRRAAHFANYGNADDSGGEDNLHTGGNEVSWMCLAFSPSCLGIIP